MRSLGFCRMVVILLLAIAWNCLTPGGILCQSVLPNQETTTFASSGSNSSLVYGDFNQVIENTTYPTTSYSGDTVQEMPGEVKGEPGVNGCYFSDGPIVQYPHLVVTGDWPVSSSNQWGPDQIGLVTEDAQKIYDAVKAGVIKSGCNVLTYQNMKIKLKCRGMFQLYESNVEQDRYVYSSETMEACRKNSTSLGCTEDVAIPAQQ